MVSRLEARTEVHASREIIYLAESDHFFVWRYQDSQTADAIRSVGNAVVKTEGTLTWDDAAIIVAKMRELRQC